ncbi:MAG: hypothetical protein V1495_01795 [Pseudomonadota bacterium]
MRPLARSILLFSVASFVLPALATVLPSPYVLKNWIEKGSGVKTVHVRQRTTLYDAKFPDGVVTVDEEIWMRRTGEYRRSASYPNGKLDLIVGRDRAVRIWGGKIESASITDTLGFLGGLYLYSDIGRLSSFLRQAGVDLGQTRWTLKEKKIGLEIGDPKSARVVFSKQDFVPMSAESGDRIYRFDAGNSKFPLRYPGVVEVSVGGRTVEKIEVMSVETNAPIPEGTFEIPRLRGPEERK